MGVADYNVLNPRFFNQLGDTKVSFDIAQLLQSDGPVVLMVADPRKTETAVQIALQYRPNSDVLSELALPIHFFNYFKAQSRLHRDVIIDFDSLKHSCCSWDVTLTILKSLLAGEETCWPARDSRIQPFKYEGRLTVIAGRPEVLTCPLLGEL